MKNIHVLPTYKPSYLYQIGNDLTLSVVNSTHQNNIGRHIYITSDEEIKEGDWYISILENEVYKATKETQNIMSVANLIGTTSYKQSHFKIVLTTYQDLIKDGVQAIDDEFLEWFVKNPSCEEVDVEESNLLNTSRTYLGVDKYKIIIPKEIGFKMENGKRTETFYSKEEAKQETLEEVAERFYGEEEIVNDYDISGYLQSAFLSGAKWQQEKMYSEEDLRNAYRWGTLVNQGTKEHFNEWFEQFKKEKGL